MTLSTAIMSKDAPEDRTFAAMLMFEGLLHKIRGTNQYGICLHQKCKEWIYFGN